MRTEQTNERYKHTWHV